MKCSYNNSFSFYKSYRGNNSTQWFANELLELVKFVEREYENPKPMDPLTSEEESAFERSTICHICEKTLIDKKVRDHSHLTGKFRGSSHESCNLNYQDSKTIVIIFHNLSGYDGHLLINEISSCFSGRISLLPINMEKYISFTKHIDNSEIKLRFIDSYRFMSASIDKLSSYLNEKKILRSQFTDLDDERFQLLSKKGIFPYDFLDSWDKFNSTELPTKDEFYSQLNDCEISDDYYRYAI